MFRYCIPRVRRRGHGLGNELVPWARAFLAAQLLDAKLLPPAFGLNRRAYWQHFGTSPDDWIFHRAVQHILPVVEFTEADYLEHGGVDAVSALRSFIEARGLLRRNVFALITEGLWGGYSHVRAAREFMRSTLYQSRYAARNLLQLQSRIHSRKILVGMHVRLGDFVAPTGLAEYRRMANASLPIEWFRNIAESLQNAFGDDWQLLLVSDGGPELLQPLLARYPCIITGDIAHGDCSDVLALASADLLVCSASSYSSLAASLSDSPYLWFAANLHEHPEGCYSMHGVANQSVPSTIQTQAAVKHFLEHPAGEARGVAIGADGEVPRSVLEAAERRRESRRWELDLVRGGVTPMRLPSGRPQARRIGL
jgi:hypothetical protein